MRGGCGGLGRCSSTVRVQRERQGKAREREEWERQGRVGAGAQKRDRQLRLQRRRQVWPQNRGADTVQTTTTTFIGSLYLRLAEQRVVGVLPELLPESRGNTS